MLPLVAVLILSFASTAIAQLRSTARDTERRIYIAPDDHTDYFWTADDVEYRQAFIETLEYYRRLADSTDGLPAARQSRWNCDGWMWLWEYQKNMPESRFITLLDRVRSGHISSPLNALVSCYGGMPAEAVLRGMLYPGKLERAYGLRFPLVVAMENQTLPLGLASLWSGSGARYSWRGVCGCSSNVPDLEHREHELYWYTGLDGNRVLMKWQSMTGGNASVGGYAEARDPFAAVDVADALCETPRYPWRIAGMFGAGWDDFTTMTNAFIRAADARSRPGRSVIVSNEEDFFHDLLDTYGDAFPSETRSYGSEWDVLCASMPETSAMIKRALTLLRRAEAMAVLLQPYRDIVGELRHERDEAWRALGLYWEHDWTADGRFSRARRAQWQRDMAAIVTDYVVRLFDSARVELSRHIRKEPASRRFYVFNALGWMRSQAADITLPADLAGELHVRDLRSGEEKPCEVFNRNGQRILRIFADSIPALGYRCYELLPGAGKTFEPAASFDGSSITNAMIEVEISPQGGIRRFVDHTLGSHNWIDAAIGMANDLGASPGTVALEHAGPVSLSVLVQCDQPFTRSTRITVYRNSRHVEMDNRITSGLDGVPLWDFPFAISSPVLHHEEVGAVLRADYEPHGHYARRNARYDWLTLNHVADMSGEEGGITLSNADAYFMKRGASTAGMLDTTSARIRVLLGGQVDGTHLGIHWSDGDSEVLQRFALRAHNAYNAARAMRFALGHQHPFVTAFLEQSGELPGSEYRLIHDTDSSLLLWAFKPAEDEPMHRILARVWNLSHQDTHLELTGATGELNAMERVTHIETPIIALSGTRITDTVRAQEMRSYLFQLERSTNASAPVPSSHTSLRIGPTWPNPAVSGESLTVPVTVDAGPLLWELRDLLGRIVLEGTHHASTSGIRQLHLGTHALTPGVYLFTARRAGEYQRRMLVLQ